MSQDESVEWVRRLQCGDAEAFDRLVDHYAGRLYGYFVRSTGDRHEAQDLTQEVFIRLVRTVGRYQHDGRFEQWLFRIAANLARDRVRKARRGSTLRVEAGGSGGNGQASGGHSFDQRCDPSAAPGDRRLVLEEEAAALGAALERLSEGEREVIMLRHYSQLSFKDIAELCDAPLGTVLARAHRGLSKLREMLGEDDSTAGGRLEERPAGKGVRT